MESIATATDRPPEDVEKSTSPACFLHQQHLARREIGFWVFQTLFWLAIAVIGLLATHAFQAAIPGAKLVILVRVLTGFTATLVLRWIFRHPLFLQHMGLVKWPLALGFCLALAVTEAVLLQAAAVAGSSPPGGMDEIGARLLVVRFFILSIWTSLYFGFQLLESAHAMELRATQAELAARENELRHLQSRMNPHFLFSALNTVIASKDDPVAVQEVTHGLSEYLRFLLKDTRPLEPLSREIDALEKYLTGQAPHFGKNLVCRIQCEKAARGMMVPTMMIQPLLEDAFQHRLQSGEAPLQIWVTARVEKGFLLVCVSSTTELPAEGEAPVRSGLQALDYRLRLLLDPEVRVEQQSDNGWSRVTLHIPLTTEGQTKIR